MLLSALLCIFAVTVSAEWGAEKVCDVKAWVRAEDLSPKAMANGDLRIKVNPSCTENIASVALQLQLDEFTEIKYLNKGAILPALPKPGNESWLLKMFGIPEHHGYYEALQDPALWVVKAEERTAWKSSVVLVKDHFDYSRPLVVPFVVAVPNVNYPPGLKSGDTFNLPKKPVTNSKHAYHYTAIVSFESGRTNKVPAGYTTFRPMIAAPASRSLAMNVTFTDWLCHSLGEQCSPNTNGTEFSGQVVLDNGDVVGAGDVVKGRITLERLVSGSTAVEPLHVQVTSTRYNHWAPVQAALAGDDIYFEPEIGGHPISTSSSYANIFRDSGICGDRGRVRLDFSEPIPFEVKITNEMIANFRAYYATSESFLSIILEILDPQKEEPEDTYLYEDGLWDPSPIGEKRYQATHFVFAELPITIVGTTHELPDELPVHYLTPGSASPLILANPPTSPKDIVFPSSQPVIVQEPVSNTTARMLSVFGSSDVNPTQDYFSGSYAGLLWEKKVLAADNDQCREQETAQQVYGAFN